MTIVQQRKCDNTRPGEKSADTYHRNAPINSDLMLDVTNEEWAAALLPTIRIAAIVCAYDAASIDEKMASLHPTTGSVVLVDLINEFNDVRNYLSGVVSIVDAAEARMRLLCASDPLAPKPARQ